MSRYERIGVEWPRQIEPHPDERPGYYETRLHRLLPFSSEEPLLFHVLTTLDQFAEGEEQLLQMMRRDVAIIPRSQAPQAKSMMFARDIVAGDDLYVFTTPCNVFSGHEDRAKRNPAVAFDARWVASQRDVAFRVHDLEPAYKRAEMELAGDMETEIDLDDEYESLSEDERGNLYLEQREEQMAEAVREQLEAIAECGTQYDPEAAQALLLLYAKLCGAFRLPGKMFVPDDDRSRIAIYEHAVSLLPECIEELEEDGEHWATELFVEEIVDNLADDWKTLFGQPGTHLATFPWQLLFSPNDRRPEILVRGSLPLCEARFYRDGEGRWLPVPMEVCEAGRDHRGRNT